MFPMKRFLRRNWKRRIKYRFNPLSCPVLSLDVLVDLFEHSPVCGFPGRGRVARTVRTGKRVAVFLLVY